MISGSIWEYFDFIRIGTILEVYARSLKFSRLVEDEQKTERSTSVYVAQLASVILIWVFVLAITLWIFNLILLAVELHDSPGASVAISIVAIPVFITLASVLTYVFVGLHKERRRISTSNEEK